MKAIVLVVFMFAGSARFAMADSAAERAPASRTLSLGVGGAFIPVQSTWVVAAHAALDRPFGDGPWGGRLTASYFHSENVNVRSDGGLLFAQVLRAWTPSLRSGLGGLLGLASGSAKNDRFRAVDGLLYGATAMPIAWRFRPELELALQAFWAKVHEDDDSLPGGFVSLSYFVL